MSKKLTTFEKCNAIKRTILRAAAESIMYESWNKDFKLKNLLEVPEIVSKWEKKHGSFKIDPNEMTKEELEKLEFGKWDKESSLMLIPIWLYPYLADNLKTISISGSEHTTKAEIDDDHRFGNLAYGVIK
jgi:hypothetical protein